MSKLLKKYTVRKKGDTCEALWSRDIEIKVHVNYHFCYIFDKIQKMTDFFSQNTRPITLSRTESYLYKYLMNFCLTQIGQYNFQPSDTCYSIAFDNNINRPE